MTKIERAEDVWNPIVGCSLASPGCTNCYAMRDAYRNGFNPKTPRYHGLTRKVNGKSVWTGEMRMAPDSTLTAPLRRRKPTRYFVNSMSDLFHEDVPDDWIDQVFAVMALCPQHEFLVLTKRAARMPTYLQHVNAHGETRHEIVERKARYFIEDADAWLTESWPLPNVWLGVSVEDQARADERIPKLLATPAAIRWISAEPLLGAVNLEAVATRYDGITVDALIGDTFDSGEHVASAPESLDWVVVGGESGPNHRPMHLSWARSIKDQCQAAGVPVFVKQLGTTCVMAPSEIIEPRDALERLIAVDRGNDSMCARFRHRKGGDMIEWPADMRVREMPPSRDLRLSEDPAGNAPSQARTLK